ncbi:hypothetical protein HanIR_Chr17g0872681 [Helianthus annuus]|nr:hypothetical protein HanIR_Chr17g0872681 [Helianthus annuus]
MKGYDQIRSLFCLERIEAIGLGHVAKFKIKRKGILVNLILSSSTFSSVTSKPTIFNHFFTFYLNNHYIIVRFSSPINDSNTRSTCSSAFFEENPV